MLFNKEVSKTWQVYNKLLFIILIGYVLLLALPFLMVFFLFVWLLGIKLSFKYQGQKKCLHYKMSLITKYYFQQNLWKFYNPINGTNINIIRGEFHGVTRDARPYQ